MPQPNKKFVIKCDNDACTLSPFAQVKATLGWTIKLYGCPFCRMELVTAIAFDTDDNHRFVGERLFCR
ncbi:MAG: hypothetical protein L0241_30965 [Planctomycetia bacterium]|nr:hypothetical protein [Planctomycetia bacterium]